MSTPVQKQYWSLKQQNPEALLFFRLGDFYELFYEDAQIASKLLGIALTARHKETANEMPMCGFPYHAHAEYLEKLVEQGYKVAIAEQVTQEDGSITRVIDRIITPGTTLESGNLDPSQNNYLMSITQDEKTKHLALAYCDLSTGEFQTTSFQEHLAFWDEVYRLNPREILLPQRLFDDADFYDRCPKVHITPQKLAKVADFKALITKQFGLSSLEGLSLEGVPLLLESVGMIIQYLQSTQKKDLLHLKSVKRYTTGDYMLLDRQTYQHLEIFQPNYTSQKDGTLKSVFKKPFTAMGGRKLLQYLGQPLIKRDLILQRQSQVQCLYDNHELRDTLSERFKALPDFERLLSRLATGRGNARDIRMIGEGLLVLPDIAILLQESDLDLFKSKSSALKGFETIAKTIDTQLQQNLPLAVTEGGLFKSSVSTELESLRSLTDESEAWLESYLASEKENTGIGTIRIKYSKNFGFCLEVSKGQSDLAPDHWVRRQTLVNAERFTTPDLSTYETKVLSSREEACKLEYELFIKLRHEVLEWVGSLQCAAQTIGSLDAYLALARTAQSRRWCAPVFETSNTSFVIKNGRHPVVESLSQESFIANDLSMKDEALMHVITGPNMAGKSTFLRQNALIIFLAQMGSFVPADSVSMPIFDRIFTRVGASDHLAAGKSTFYIEMAETAQILNQATEKSFVILDELGRGTSTFDGLSLAWAITEYIHDHLRCKTLLATHYHELIDLAQRLEKARNYHVSVAQHKGGITFLRKIEPGGIADSFGIEVARLAGIPGAVVQKAQEILVMLESEDLLNTQPTLFSQPLIAPPALPESMSAQVKRMSEIDPDDLTPKEALAVLYEIKAMKND